MAMYKKKQLLQILRTLKNTNDSIRGAEQKSQAEVIEILTQCQELAVDIGTDIEMHQENGGGIVRNLEKYCEDIYRQSIAMSDQILFRKLEETIRERLVKIENMIRYELPEDRKEVVFLPYMASMWDSMESVWIAARDDDNCDEYVISIPYFQKIRNGDFGQMFYEGHKFPDYVPITSWEEFDLENRRPDVIYIHNPYDNTNHVTSIHPQFYAKHLRKLTERLIYIPYFILEEIDPGDQDLIEKMKHYCFLPGTIYADNVIVQSENMRNIYVNEYMKVIEENNIPINRMQVEEKFFGTGSPKFDKVQNSKKDNLNIPEEWLNIIRKRDGSWKKIIFYNTNISALLENDEKMLEKMEDVFQTLKENQDKVTLLWRPHPLIPNTIQSMRPHLWKKYNDIVEQYIEEKWGIFDDTTDVDRAVILSDAYYGDGGSVLQIYLKTGKPFSIQTFGANVINESKQETLNFLDAIFIEEKMWFTAANRNGLFCYDFEKKETELVNFFGDRNLWDVCLYSRILQFQDKLILIPFQADNLILYDRKNKKIMSKKISDYNKGKKYSLFYTALQDEKSIYLIPCRCSGMIQYNVMEDEMIYHDVLRDEFYDKGKEDEPAIMKGACFANGNIYLGSYVGNIIEEYDTTDKKAVFYSLPIQIKGISHLTYENQIFWVICREGSIIRWNKEKNSCRLFEIEEPSKANFNFLDALYFEDVIYLTGSYSGKIYSFDTRTEKTDIIWKLNRKADKKYDHWSDFTSLMVTPEGKIAVFSNRENQLLFDLGQCGGKDRYEKYYFELKKSDDFYYKKVFEYISKRSGDLGLDIETMIKILPNVRTNKEKNCKKIGEDIYKGRF